MGIKRSQSFFNRHDFFNGVFMAITRGAFFNGHRCNAAKRGVESGAFVNAHRKYIEKLAKDKKKIS